MTTSQLTPWEEWSKSPPSPGHLHDVARSTVLTKVTYIHEGRNAWYSTWVNQYYPKRCALALTDAKDAVEPMRVQGSRWTIVELPALAFVGTHTTLLVSEFNDLKRLSRTSYSSSCKPFLGHIAEAVVPSAPNDIMRLVVANPCPLPSARAFRTYRSYALGGTYPLGWHESAPIRSRPAALRRMRQAHEQSLEACTYLGIAYECDEGGCRVDRLLPESPLAGEGMKAGDLVVALQLGLKKVEGPEVDHVLPSLAPSQTVRLVVQRGAARFEFDHRCQSFRQALGL